MNVARRARKVLRPVELSKRWGMAATGALEGGRQMADDYKAGKMLRERCGRKVVVAVAGREGG